VPTTVVAQDGVPHGGTDVTSLISEVEGSGKKGAAKPMDDMQIQEYVRYSLFSKWKFFTSKQQLAFDARPRSICFKIMSDLHVDPSNRTVWWEENKLKIVMKLNRKRSDVTTQIRKAFKRE
jgi:hypothetical protein